MTSFFERNTTLKIISILIALLLWGMTPNNRDPLRDMSFRDIPLKIENQQRLLENGLMISSNIPDSYSFDIRAKASMVKFLDRSKIIATINLSDINKTGEQSVAVDLQGLPGTSNIEIKSAPDIKINVERIVSKVIPIISEVSQQEEQELGKRHYEIDPATVEVRGPESLVSTVAYAKASFLLGDKDKKLERSQALQIYNNTDEEMELGLLSLNPEYCVVTVFPNKIVGVDAMITGKPASGYVIIGEEVKPENIIINGNPEVLETIKSLTTDILDVEGAKNNIIRELKLQLQEGINISPGQASSVQVLVRIEKIVDKQFSFNDVEIRNVPEGLDAGIEDGEGQMSLTVKGPQSLINSTKLEDIKLYVDLGESSRGGRIYPVMVEKLPPGLEIVSIEPKSLRIVLD